MSNYKGMRWLKCDLQMQTPADARHWTGDQMVEGQEAQVARAFAEACYSKKMDVVGITDHNFLSKDFLPYLKTAFHDIEQEFGHKITMFPGFEFEADVGKGIHVLCLFEPDIDLDDIDHILTDSELEDLELKVGDSQSLQRDYQTSSMLFRNKIQMGNGEESSLSLMYLRIVYLIMTESVNGYNKKSSKIQIYWQLKCRSQSIK